MYGDKFDKQRDRFNGGTLDFTSINERKVRTPLNLTRCQKGSKIQSFGLITIEKEVTNRYLIFNSFTLFIPHLHFVERKEWRRNTAAELAR